ncbi:MAG: hypothetical protein A2882_10430 [Phenylobacterium sp. RIFCSPHIGHO2_01_FULL_70_10]|nr:MAG: hypothetical protein A2882_10430 [Phenylobacterium sp. RIFCSPHIGHO2_01_FULL_70_10]
MLKSELLAADYRRHAGEALNAAAESPLPEVRKRCRASAQSWILLAEMQDRRTLLARRLAARALPVASAGECVSLCV